MIPPFRKLQIWKKVKKLEANEEFYLGLKRRLEEENKNWLSRKTNQKKEEIASNLSDSMTESQNLRGQIQRLEDELSEAQDDLVRAQKVDKSNERFLMKKNRTPEILIEEMLVWAKKNSTFTISAGDRGEE